MMLLMSRIFPVLLSPFLSNLLPFLAPYLSPFLRRIRGQEPVLHSELHVHMYCDSGSDSDGSVDRAGPGRIIKKNK